MAVRIIKNTKNCIKTWDDTYRFQEVFNPETGLYIRSDTYGKYGDTGQDPFMRSFPNLLDVGIMGGCKVAQLGLCRAGGMTSGCYQGGRPYNPDKDMSLSNYKRIIDEGYKKGLQQVALGGAGNPNDHQNFREILEYTRKHNIVPNYTTAGLNLTDEMVQATKEYCGAVAVSWYRQKFTVDALQAFSKIGCKTNIHFVLSKTTIDIAINLLENHYLDYILPSGQKQNYEPENINAIIFLLYKPVGLGKNDLVLSLDDNNQLEKFFELVEKEHPFKIGFDSCSIPAILNYTDQISENSIDTCEGARFSAYINAEMKMVPCSFDQDLKWAVDLNKCTIEQAWNSEKFNSFRKKLNNSCKTCPNKHLCMGGCPIKPEIVICGRKKHED